MNEVGRACYSCEKEFPWIDGPGGIDSDGMYKLGGGGCYDFSGALFGWVECDTANLEGRLTKPVDEFVEEAIELARKRGIDIDEAVRQTGQRLNYERKRALKEILERRLPTHRECLREMGGSVEQRKGIVWAKQTDFKSYFEQARKTGSGHSYGRLGETETERLLAPLLSLSPSPEIKLAFSLL